MNTKDIVRHPMNIRSRHIARNHTNHPVGENHHRAKLSDTQVRAMRAMREEGLSYGRLAQIFGCGESTARDIVQWRTRWTG